MALSVFGLFSSTVELDAREPQPGVKIGVFDMQKIIRESKTVGAHRQQFLQNVQARRKPLQDRENLIKTLDEKLKKDGRIMSATDRKVFEEKLAGEIKDMRRMKEDFDAEVAKMDRELMQKVFSEIGGIVKTIAEQENYDVIFDAYRAGIVHYRNTIDITGKILERLK